MTRKFLTVVIAIAASACAHANSGLYAGGGLTEVRASNVYGLDLGCGGCADWRLDSTSWEAIAGWRPVHPFAVEAKYESLGRSSAQLSHGNALLDGNAAGLYAIGFFPLPPSVIDLFGKVGLVRSELHGHSYTFHPPRSDSGTELALGAGVQANLGRVGLRLEYERFNIPQTTHAYIYSIAATFALP
jgi:hypothetical protein